MKKIFGIMMIILGAVIIFIGSMYITNKIIFTSNINNYNNRKTIIKEIESESLNKDFSENNFIELGDLTISLENLRYYPNGNDDYQPSLVGASNDNLLLTTINLSNKEKLPVDIKLLQYIIFDENNNILDASYHSENGLNYMKGFLYEKYSETSFERIPEHMVCKGRTKNNITEDISIVSTTYATNLNSIPKQINIRLFDLKYSINGKETKELGLDDIEFVVNIK